MEILIIVLLVFILALIIFLILSKRNDPALMLITELEKKIVATETSIRNEFFQNRTELGINLKDSRAESAESIKSFGASLNESLRKLQEQINADAKYNRDELSKTLKSFQETFTQEIKFFSDTLEKRLKYLQDDNNQKLDKMRETVDEKLQTTLEKRLGESFKFVSDRLEQVHKGLGEMQTLAIGVGDIKRVLSNIKTKGVLGEYQLENILEQLLTKDQYSKNVKTKSGSSANVEFAVKLPGRENNKPLWLPIDSKFPTQDYQILLDAFDSGNVEEITEGRKNLVKRIKDSAKEIRDKYIDPPNTTDFAIMFLPFEGLYAEVLNNAGLFETIQRDFKITITGPTTLSALLNSLQMGFRTLSIEKRTGEVWEVLGSVKTEFSKFGEILEKTKKKLNEAANTLDTAEVRSRAIEKKLKDVQLQSSMEEQLILIDRDVTTDHSVNENGI
ncbi:MAG: DNA recombination protein RmuC [bacterium]